MLLRTLLFIIMSVVAASAQTRQIYVTWAASASVGTADFTGYKVYRCNPSPCTPTVQIGTSTTNTYFDTGLANSTSYVYTWSAYGPGGETPSGQTSTATTYGAPTTRNVTCSGDISSAVQTAANASADGDIVNIGAGSCTMSGLLIQDKAITIQGQGQGVTNITGNIGTWVVNTSNAPTFRITGFSLTDTGTPSSSLVLFGDQDASWRGPFRIDHVDFNYPNAGPDGIIQIYGPLFGLIDHCNFTQSFEAMILTAPHLNTEGGSVTDLKGAFVATLPYQPGAGNYLYIEDSTFTANSASGAAAYDTGYSGGRLVFRHNTTSNSGLFAHWTSANSINSMWWEVYNNTFSFSNASPVEWMRMEGGGSGIIYNNTTSGFVPNSMQLGDGRLESNSGAPLLLCDGTHNWDGNAGDASATGWPCLMQTGRDAGKTVAQIQAGNRQANFPLYMWNNGPQAKCSNPAAAGAACDNTAGVTPNEAAWFKSTPHTVSGGGYGQGDVDYCVNTSQPSGCGTHTLTYTPYTYPHPLNH